MIRVEPTREQLVALRDKYLRHLLDADGPVDRDEAEATVCALYKYAGMPPPREFIWCEHPEDALIAATLVAVDRLRKPIPPKWHDALDGILVGRRLREEIINPDGSMSDVEMRQLVRFLRSLADTCRVFKDRLGARGLLTVTERTPFAEETWMDAFDCIEEQIEWHSPEFAAQMKPMVARVSEYVEREGEHLVRLLSSIGDWILQASTSFWEWTHPPMLAGSLEAIYAAIAELQEQRENEGIMLLQQFIAHCGWCFPFLDICIIADRPDRLFSLKDIRSEANIEVRRLMIDLYGLPRYLKDARAELISADRYGELYRCREGADEDLMVVKVKNSTPEPDGTFREYFLKVPPNIRTPRQGIAWSFDLEEHQYNPSVET